MTIRRIHFFAAVSMLTYIMSRYGFVNEWVWVLFICGGWLIWDRPKSIIIFKEKKYRFFCYWYFGTLSLYQILCTWLRLYFYDALSAIFIFQFSFTFFAIFLCFSFFQKKIDSFPNLRNGLVGPSVQQSIFFWGQFSALIMLFAQIKCTECENECAFFI